MRYSLPCSILWFLAATSGVCDVRLPSLFGDHMVLQQGLPVPVWGTAKPGDRITVSVAGKKGTATADSEGRWMLRLDPLPAMASPTEMEVVAAGFKRVFKDVLVGEVWLCSGQSNMAASRRDLVSGEAESEQIRFFKTPNVAASGPRHEVEGSWVVCTPEEANKLFLSAVGYYFAAEIQRDRGVPVGIIQSAWSGTAIESWLNLEALEQSEAFSQLAKRVKTTSTGDEPASEHQKKLSRVPTGIFNGMVHPHIPYAIRGVLWYQGESNARTEKQAREYATLFPLLISGWRALWGQGDFPFLYVQLPGFTTDRPWHQLRQSQLETLAVPNTGMAVALDLNPTDNLHPPDKTAVGERLALLALKIAYGKTDLTASGPLFQSMAVEGNKIRLSFTETGSGLAPGGPPDAYLPKGENPETNEGLLGFEIAADDGVFAPANAMIDGKTILVWSDGISRPTRARYAWASRPKANLYNREGLPASPFRTDNEPAAK